MTSEEQQLRRLKHRRIRRVKRWLRPLPRRATIHRYPVLRWFKDTARSRSYLWSFRKQEVVPALYIGCILSLMPVYGIQIPLALLLALVFRSNLMIMVGLQFITNPFTVAPLYFAGYSVGDYFLQLFYTAPNLIEYGMIDKAADESLLKAIGLIIAEHKDQSAKMILHLFNSMIVGGVIIGYFMGFVSSLLYQLFMYRAKVELAVLQGRADRVSRLRKENEEAVRSLKPLKKKNDPNVD